MDVHDSPIVRNELKPANHMNGIEPMESMISPQEIPNFETGEKHEIGVNNQIAGLGSNFMENRSSRKLLNCVAGTSRAMEVDRELVKPCSQTAVVEYADSGNVCAVDEDLLLESGCLNMSRVLQKGLPEELEPKNAIGKVVNSQDGARSESLQKPMIRLSLKSTA
ncbi:hypothetical protein OIU79_030234 [Salix purpurea]|uniref:Uncharacterized protein n=1 Tax=Salix purpurea TaxID=77065 RepID=A0A9Q0ZWA1_SALPP|nr:hypothetical protein OIU79_030234 [Salix purpurea]